MEGRSSSISRPLETKRKPNKLRFKYYPNTTCILNIEIQTIKLGRAFKRRFRGNILVLNLVSPGLCSAVMPPGN